MLTREQSNKLPRELENPIDNIVIDFTYFFGDSFKRNKFTPNMLTTLSTITAILCLYTVYNKKYILGIVFLFISYFFDCFDGNFARRYNMETHFGDYFDHIKDIIFYVILQLLLFYRLRKHPLFFIVLFVYLIIFILGLLFHGCTNIYIRNKNIKFLDSKTISSSESLCYSKPEKLIRKYRYYSMGTSILYLGFIIYLLHSHQ